jgi:uncharacterized protein
MNTSKADLLIIGASTRAAAFSALRAGLQPWCVDLFADADLQARCPVQRLTGKYPEGFAPVIASARPGPWMYTGGLENRAALLEKWQRRRPLWGIWGEPLGKVRDPLRVQDILRDEGLPWVKTRLDPPADRTTRWVVKSRHSSGGLGVRHWTEARNDLPFRAGAYWQEYVEGQAAAAIYAAVNGTVHFLGLTRQLIGTPWLQAKPFQYCGSIGPLVPNAELRQELIVLGSALGRRCNLVGLFGVDGVLTDGHFWAVEVNPRYTASVEVLEYATGLRALAWHRRAFDAAADAPVCVTASDSFFGKAILYAPRDVIFPQEGPWLSALSAAGPIEEMPTFADVPAAGEHLTQGQPILTFFVRQPTLARVENALYNLAADLLRCLYP